MHEVPREKCISHKKFNSTLQIVNCLPWVEGDAHAAEDADAWLVEADRLFEVSVEGVVDPGEQGEAWAHLIVAGEVEHRIRAGHQARDLERPVDIHPRSLVEEAGGEAQA